MIIENGIGIFILSMQDEPKKRRCPAKTWVKRFGAAGFVFFLIKGLLWLLLPAAIAYFTMN